MGRPGQGDAAGPLYIHVLTAEDFFIQGCSRVGRRCGTESAGRRAAASDGRREAKRGTMGAAVRMDMPKLREYAKVVFAAIDTYLDSLSETDLAKEIEFFGRNMSLAAFFLGVTCIDLRDDTGEISTSRVRKD